MTQFLYEVSSLNMNTNKKLGLFVLLGILQDVTGEHAAKLGFDYDVLTYPDKHASYPVYSHIIYFQRSS